MKPLTSPQPSLLFTAILANDIDLYDQAVNGLIDHYGPVSLAMAPEHFAHTSYYNAEMGGELIKGFAAFQPPHNPGNLSQDKLICRSLEWKYNKGNASNPARSVNIDPGLVTLANVILATSKNFSHRVYLGNSIYAEVTLLYHANGWEELPWTYPDYKILKVQSFLSKCRKRLRESLK